MPRIPSYDTPQVAPRPLPGVQVNTNIDPIALGGGIGQGMSAVGKGAYQVGQIIEKARSDARDIRLEQFANDLGQWRLERLHNPETGALTKRGEDAFGEMEKVDNDYRKFVGDKVNGFSDEITKQRAYAYAEKFGLNVDQTMHQHVAQEKVALDEEKYINGNIIDANLAAANHDKPEHLADLRLNRELRIAGYAKRNGKPQEWIDAETLKVSTVTHQKVLDAFLANRNASGARAYFDANENEIEADTRAKMDENITKVNLANDIIIKTDEVFKTHKTAKEQNAAISTVENGELRTGMEKRAGELRLIDKQAEAVDHAVARDEVHSYMRAQVDAAEAKSPPEQWSGELMGDALIAYLSLPPDDRDSLDKLRTNMLQGVDVVTKFPKYQALLKVMLYDPDEFKLLNLPLKYGNSLSREHLERFIDWQTGLKSGNQKTSDRIKGMRSEQQIIDGGLGTYFKDLTPKEDTAQAKRIEVVRRLIEDEMTGWYRANPTASEIPTKELRAIVDRQITAHAFKRYDLGIDWLDTDKLILPSEATIDDIESSEISAERRDRIRRTLIDAGKSFQEDDIKRRYLQELRETGK